jgi:hypothetical protein
MRSGRRAGEVEPAIGLRVPDADIGRGVPERRVAAVPAPAPNRHNTNRHSPHSPHSPHTHNPHPQAHNTQPTPQPTPATHKTHTRPQPIQPTPARAQCHKAQEPPVPTPPLAVDGMDSRPHRHPSKTHSSRAADLILNPGPLPIKPRYSSRDPTHTRQTQFLTLRYLWHMAYDIWHMAYGIGRMENNAHNSLGIGAQVHRCIPIYLYL